jgi:signal transduction histidine kinase
MGMNSALKVVETSGLHEDLSRYRAIGSQPEEIFDRLTRLAAHACDTPIALINLTDGTRRWFKSWVGSDLPESADEHAFFAPVNPGAVPWMLEDTRADSRFTDNPFIGGTHRFRFCASVPIKSPRGVAVGNLSVIDRRPRRLTIHQRATLDLIAKQITDALEIRLLASALRHQSKLLEKTQSGARIGSWELDLSTAALAWTDETYRIHGVSRQNYRPGPASALAFYRKESRRKLRLAVEAAALENAPFDMELSLLKGGANARWVRVIGEPDDDPDQAPRICGTVQDITERRELERAMIHGVHEEQARIGRDLHDGLGQELTGASLILGSVASVLVNVPGPVREDLGQVAAILRDSIQACRTLARGASPTAGSHGGLVAALHALCEHLERRHHAGIEFHTLCDEPAIGELAADHVFRIAQEALTNALKHGRSHHIVVSLSEHGNRTVLSIDDDGVGFTRGAKSEGMGLRIMRHRAGLVGGTLDLSTRPGGGTRVRCRVPHSLH